MGSKMALKNRNFKLIIKQIATALVINKQFLGLWVEKF